MSKIYRMIAPTGEAFETENPDWHKSCRIVKKAEYLAARKDYARLTLLRMIEPGSTVYTKVLHVSRSGMKRRISAYVATKDNPPDTSITTLAVSSWMAAAWIRPSRWCMRWGPRCGPTERQHRTALETASRILMEAMR